MLKDLPSKEAWLCFQAPSQTSTLPKKGGWAPTGVGLWGFPSFIVAVRPGAWEGPPRKGWSQDWEKGCIREARETKSREGWEAGWEGSWRTHGKLSAKHIYVFGFWGAFNSHPCFSWLLVSWVREGWLNTAMPQKKKKKNFNEKSFCVFPHSDYHWKTSTKFTEEKDSSFSPPTPVVTLSMSQSKCQKKKASSQENINIYRQHYSITPEMLNRASSPFLFFIDLVMWYIIIRKPKKKGNSRTQVIRSCIK